MPLELHPYDPDKEMRDRATRALNRVWSEHAAQRMEPIPDPETLVKAREWRRKWYHERGGKEICAKNGRDRRARLKKAGKL